MIITKISMVWSWGFVLVTWFDDESGEAVGLVIKADLVFAIRIECISSCSLELNMATLPKLSEVKILNVSKITVIIIKTPVYNTSVFNLFVIVQGTKWYTLVVAGTRIQKHMQILLRFKNGMLFIEWFKQSFSSLASWNYIR